MVKLYQVQCSNEPRNYEFATIQRLMIVGKGQNTWRYSSFEGESCIERDILLNLIVERGKRFAYPFNDMCWIVKRYRGNMSLFKKKVTYFSRTRHIYYRGGVCDEAKANYGR